MKKTKENIENYALGCKMGRAYQILLSQLADALKNEGLNISTNEYLILRALYSRNGIQQCEIVEMTGKEKATVCRCVAGLEKHGLVTTETVSHKCQRVYLSDSARALEPKIQAVAIARHNALAELTSAHNLEIFSLILDKIITNSK